MNTIIIHCNDNDDDDDDDAGDDDDGGGGTLEVYLYVCSVLSLWVKLSELISNVANLYCSPRQT